MADETNNGLYTRYLRLAYGDDALRNRNWDILDGRALDLARELFANIPAGGDLQGYYPDPTIRDGAVSDAQITDVAWSKVTGAPADQGTTILDGAGHPSDLTGDGGDYYLDTAAGILYGPKADYAPPASMMTGVAAPSQPAAASGGYTIATEFEAVTGGRVTALRFYRSASATLTSRILSLWNGTNVIAASEPTVETAGQSGWIEARLLEPAALAPGSRYFVSVNVPVGSFYVYSGLEPVSATPALTFITARYGNGVDALPDVVVDGFNYYVDVVYEAVADLPWPVAIAGGGGGGGEWTDDAANFILYTTNVRNLAFRSGGASLFLNDPLEGATASIESSGRTTLRLSAGDAAGGVVLTLGSPRVGVTNGGMFVGSDTTFMDARERLDVAGGILLGAATNTNDGTLQWTGTTFQGRVGGAWVDIPGAGGGGGDSVWLADNYVLKPIDPLVWAVQLPPAGAFLGGASPSDCGSLKLESTAITLLCTANGSTFDVVMDGGTHILAADSSRVTVNGFLFADGIELDTTIRLGLSGPAPSDGTLQYTGTKFQGRVAGAWVDIPGTGGGGSAGPNRTYRTLAGGTTVLDATAEVHYASAISNATLPLASSCPGRVYEFAPANQINLSRSGSDTIVVGTAAGVTSLAITASMRVTLISDGTSAWRVIAADPALSITGLNAGGSLSGTYPNPSLAANSVNAVQIAAGQVQPTKMAGTAPAAGDVGKLVVLDHTNPTTQWKISGVTIDAAGLLTLPFLDPTITFGGTNAGRVSISGTSGQLALITNNPFAPHDTASNAWLLALRQIQDDVVIFHRASGGASPTLTPFQLTGAGALTLGGPLSLPSGDVALGSATAKLRLQENNANPGVGGLFSNRNFLLSTQDDATKPSWGLLIHPASDNFTVQRSPAGSTTMTNLLSVNNVGGLTTAGDIYVSTSAVFLNKTDAVARGLVQTYPYNGSAILELSANSAQFLAAKPVWTLRLDAAASVEGFQVLRQAPSGGAVTTPILVNAVGDLIIAGSLAQKASGTTWANPSDRRIKDEIADYPTGLDIVTQLQPRTFVYNGKGGSVAGMRGYGFVADEVAGVMPEMVGTHAAKLDADDEELTDIQTVDQSNLILALVNSVQELAARVAALEAA